MQRDPTTFTGKPSLAYGHEADVCLANGSSGGLCNNRVPASPAFIPEGMTSPKLQSPLGVFQFHPSKVCPRNFIIFDQNDDRGRIIHHPALVNKLTPTNNINVFLCRDEVICRSSSQDNGNLEEESSSFKEDSEEIDALLSSDEGSDEDDVMSTGRSPDPLDSYPFDSSSPPMFMKMRHFSGTSSDCHGSMENITHEKIRKMVTVLRGIVPGGGDELDTPAFLEEAVRYLKSLKMEAKNLGVEGLDK
jgi:hypothetical protein